MTMFPTQVSVTATPHTAVITSLKFDGKGTLLCVIDAHSRVSIWSMQDHIVNDWQLLQITDSFESSCVSIDTQPVICFSWTNIGLNYVRKTWSVKPEDVSSYWTSKFSREGPSTLLKSKLFTPSVMMITSRGLLTLLSPGKKIRNSYLPITNMQTADIVTSGKSYVDIATVDTNCTLRLYTVELAGHNIKFALSRIVNLSPDKPNAVIGSLKFNNSLSLDSDFFITITDPDSNSTFIEKWKFTKSNVNVNPVLRAAQTTELALKLHWEKEHSCQLADTPVSIGVPFLPYPVSTLSDPNKIGRVVAVSCKDGSIQLLDRHNLTIIDSIGPSLFKGVEEEEETTSSPSSKSGDVHFSFSPAGCCLAGVVNNVVSIFSFRNTDLDIDRYIP